MRVAHVVNSVEGGGVAAAIPQIDGALRQHGAEVRVLALTARDARGLAAIERAGIQVVVRPGGRTDHLSALLWLNRELRAFAPTHILTSLTRAALLGQIAGAMRGLPVVSWQHNAPRSTANRLLLGLTQRLSRLWIADSSAIADVVEHRLGVPRARLAVWPLFEADAAAPRARPWRPGETLRLGVLGRLHPVKGHDVLIAALGRLRADGFVPAAPIDLSIAGEGNARARLTAQVAAAGIGDQVRFIGYTEAPRDYLAGLHLYLQPSRSEGMCIAAHEAMQAGLPTIVSAVGELPNSVIDGETGRLVAPGEPAALSAALADLLSRPAELEAMGQASRRRVFERFGPAAFAAAGDAVIERLATTGRAPAFA